MGLQQDALRTDRLERLEGSEETAAERLHTGRGQCTPSTQCLRENIGQVDKKE